MTITYNISDKMETAILSKFIAAGGYGQGELNEYLRQNCNILSINFGTFDTTAEFATDHDYLVFLLKYQ